MTDKKEFNQVTSSSYSSKICCNVFFRPVGTNIINLQQLSFVLHRVSSVTSPMWGTILIEHVNHVGWYRKVRGQQTSGETAFSSAHEHNRGLKHTPANCNPHITISSFFTTAHWCGSSITDANRTCQSPRGILFSSTWYSCSPLYWTLRATLLCERTATPHLRVLTPFPSRVTLSSKKAQVHIGGHELMKPEGWQHHLRFSPGRRTNVPELEDFSRRSCNSLPFP